MDLKMASLLGGWPSSKCWEEQLEGQVLRVKVMGEVVEGKEEEPEGQGHDHSHLW